MKKTTTIALSLILAGGVLYGCAPKQEDTFKPRVVAPKTNTVNAAYTEYSEAAVPMGAPYVLFFHADWCPTCVAWEASVKGSQLPENALILKVNYDESEELKAQYGITMQSTAVMIDAEGNVVATAADPSMEDVAAFFDNYAVSEEDTMPTEEMVTEEVSSEESMEEPMNEEEMEQGDGMTSPEDGMGESDEEMMNEEENSSL